MTRGNLVRMVDEELERVRNLFLRKNISYGDENQAFYNFIETARRKFGTEDLRRAFDVLWILADKHWTTLGKEGLDDPEAEERLRDMVVYSLIGIAMLKKFRSQ